MSVGPIPGSQWTNLLLEAMSAVVVQTATPDEVGPGELVEFWPTVVRAGWFLAGFVAVVLVGRLLVEPVVTRIIQRRNRNNPTIRGAIVLYFRLFVLLLGVFVGAGVAGYGRLISSSALVIGAATLAVGVAAQEVIGSLVSGLALVFDPEFNVGDYIQWADQEGTVQSITLRTTRVETPDGTLVTVPNTILTNESVMRPFGRGNYRVVEHVAIDELAGDAVVFLVHYWIANPDRRDIFEVRSSYAREVLSRLDSAGITVSPPSKRDLEGRIEIDDRG